MSDLHTPQAVAALEDAVRVDLAAVSALVVEGSSLLERLEDSLRVLPSSQSRIRGWRQSLDLIVGNIAEEAMDVSRKLLGGSDPNPISEAVDQSIVVALRERVS